jgi:hypothetical protein
VKLKTGGKKKPGKISQILFGQENVKDYLCPPKAKYSFDRNIKKRQKFFEIMK